MPGLSLAHRCTYRAVVDHEVGVVKHAELARVVDCAAAVTVDVLKTKSA